GGLARSTGRRQGLSCSVDRRISVVIGHSTGDSLQEQRSSRQPPRRVRSRGVSKSKHRRTSGGLAQGKPSHLLAIREDRNQFRRHDQIGFHQTVSTFNVYLAF